MLRKIMIVLVAGVALAWAPTAEAAPHGGGFGGGHMGGGFGGARFGGGFGGPRLGGQALGRAFAGPNLVTPRGHFGHYRGFGHRRFARGYGYGYYDDGCSYRYPYYYNRYSCYLPSY
jgi:hypothetical protein